MDNDMKNYGNGSDDSFGGDALSDLEALTKKYGLSKEDSKTNSNNSDFINSYLNDKPVSKTPVAPKNNRPAYTPKIVYDIDSPTPSIRIDYGSQQKQTKGPEGRRVVYEAKEETPFVRRRPAQTPAEKSQTSVSSRQYVQKSEDSDKFAKTYATAVAHVHPYYPKTTLKSHVSGDVPVFDRKESDIPISRKPAIKEPSRTAEKEVHQHYEVTAKDRFRNAMKAIFPWKGDSGKEAIRKLVMDLSAIVVLFCFGYFVQNFVAHQNALKNQQNMQNAQSEIETDELDAQWAAIKAKYPNVNFPDGMNIKYAELYAKNQDLVGWLKIDNTNIDTPIVQHKEDAVNDAEEDLYLHHDFYKKYNKYGNAYLDRYNTGNALDTNNTIYGHNMTDGLMFAQLEKYYKIDGFKESPIIQYSTLFHDYYFKVYAVIITNGSKAEDNGYLFNYTNAHFPNDASFTKFIEALDERKLYDTGVDITKDDVLLTLSTCSYEIKNNGRLAVIGRMVRPGEAISVDTSKAVQNDDIRYPQSWYDERSMSNPFANAYQWSVND